MSLPLILGIALAVIHYFSEKFHLLEHIHRMKFISFTGGIFITYLILDLLPALFEGGVMESRISLLFVLIGFSLFHLLEKYVYREAQNREVLRKELKEIHSLTFFLYHFVIGMILVSVIDKLGLMTGILFFIPIFLITLVSSISLKEIHGRIREKKAVKLLLSISTLLGVVVATLFPLTFLLYSILLGFVVGALLFVVIVDSIPRERKGEPVFFILGVALYALIIGATWII